MAIAKVVRKFRVSEQPTDAAYWRAQPPEVRLATIEEIRSAYHGWTDDSQPRVERVCRIVKQV